MADEKKSTEEKVLDPKEIHRESADTILQEGIDFYITLNQPNWFARKGILPKLFPKEKHFYIKPMVAGTLIRISKIMTELDFVDTVQRSDFINKGIELMAKDVEPLTEIIAYAITNSEKKPSTKLKQFLKQNLTMDEILGIVTLVLKQMDVSNFMNSIILVKGMSLIKQGG